MIPDDVKSGIMNMSAQVTRTWLLSVRKIFANNEAIPTEKDLDTIKNGLLELLNLTYPREIYEKEFEIFLDSDSGEIKVTFKIDYVLLEDIIHRQNMGVHISELSSGVLH